MGQTLFKQVRRFVNEQTLKPLLQITPETSLYFDLDLTTETAPAFFVRFAEEFEVDLQGMNLQPYFQPGGHDFIGGEAVTALWLFWFFTNERHHFAGIKPLLVSDLVTLAKTKRWCL